MSEVDCFKTTSLHFLTHKMNIMAVVASIWQLWAVAVAADTIDDLLGKYSLDRHVRYDDIDSALSWSLIPKATEIEVQIIVPVSSSIENSWIALGISDTNGMIGTDVAVFTWLNPNKIYDMYSNDFDTPSLDTIHDWKLIEAISEDSYSIIRMSRNLDTCDSQDISFNKNYARFWLIIAYKQRDESLTQANEYELNTISYHSARGSKEIKLWFDETIYESTSVFDTSVLTLNNNCTTDTDTLDFNLDWNGTDSTINFNGTSTKSGGLGTNGAFNVSYSITLNDIYNSSDISRYYCMVLNFTVENIYTTAFEMYSNDNRNFNNLLHHISVYECSSVDASVIMQHLNGKCAFDSEIMKDCSVFMTIMPSVGKIELPNTIFYQMNVGIYVWQFHYELSNLVQTYNGNDNKKINVKNENVTVDSSVQIWYETNRRTYELMITGAIGTFSSIDIPANTKYNEFSYAITDSCTNEYIPKNDGIMLLAVGPHMHTKGVSTKITLIKENLDARVIFNKKYDYDRQFLTWFNNVYLFPNDTLKISCIYDTKNTNTRVKGGSIQSQEMCVFYFLYITLSTDQDEVAKLKNFSRIISDGMLPSNKVLHFWNDII